MITPYIKRTINKAFKDTRFTVTYGNDHINIMTPKGIHCEFYTGAVDNKSCYVTATYKLNNKKTNVDLYIPDQVNDFVIVVKTILKGF